MEAAYLAGAIQLEWHEHVCASCRWESDLLKNLFQGSDRSIIDRQMPERTVGGKTAGIEGEPPRRIVINAFANLDAAVAAYNSPAYKEAAKSGSKYGMFRIYAVEGLQR